MNFLFLMPDEHSRRVAGCYGNAVAKTPNIDALAARGTLFTDAYCNSPICVPSRAALATGRYVHDTGYWDNAEPYDGRVKSWHHHLAETGHRMISVGKLHFRDENDPVGFTEQILPMHVVAGKGDLHGLLRRPPRQRSGMRRLAAEIGAGESSYADYDRKITEAVCAWLAGPGRESGDRPWAMFVSLVCPHFPLIAPQEFFDLYRLADMPWPLQRRPEEAPSHPVVQAFRRYQNYDDYFETEEQVRTAIASYYGLVSFVDHNIGRMLMALDAAGLTEDTLVIYTSDHGDNLGTRGFWGKSLMYEESVGVPMILAGPGVPRGTVVREPVSLVDVYPTAVEAVGERLDATEAAELPGTSLIEMANGSAPRRTVLSEYHAVGAVTGVFMIRHGRWKYVHYEGYAPQLFDLEADPFETRDLGTDPAHAPVVAECEARLRTVVDPAEATARAFRDQQRIIDANGGADAILAQGEFSHTPAPGEEPVYG